MTKCLQAVATKFEKTAMKFVMSNKKAEKVQQDLAIFNTAGSYKYPPGVQPYKERSDEVEYDKVWSKASDQDFGIQIQIPAGATRHDVLRQCHHRFARLQKEIEAEVVADNNK